MYCMVLLFLDIPIILGCRGGGGQGGGSSDNADRPTTESTTILTGKRGDAVERNIASGFSGFNPPRDVEQMWRQWLKQYELDMEEETMKGADGDEIDRSPGSGWPARWMGLDGGHGGGPPPPPWAYVPIDTGLPSFCYLAPEKGTCNEELIRFGYNAITQKCQEFNYSGCGENQNNFKKKESCEVACMPMPIAGCEFDTQQYIEDD